MISIAAFNKLRTCVRDLCAKVGALESAVAPDLDEQQLTLVGNILTLEDGGQVDLTPFLDNTDDQIITAFSLSPAGILTLTIEGGNTVTVDLTSLDTDTDDQTLALAGTLLSIADGNTVDLAAFLDNTDSQTLTPTVVGGETTAITISGGNTIPILHNHPTQAVPLPATTIPIADNEVDTAIRTGQAGTSTLYARADHNHPIRRQANPGDPVVTAGGSATISQAIVLDRWSTEETYEFALRIRVAQPAGTGWGWVNIPTIAGFQQPQIYLGTYRSDSNAPQTDATAGAGLDGASPRGPFMSHEAHHWSSTRRLYLAYFRRDEAITSMFIEPIVRYIRL